MLWKAKPIVCILVLSLCLLGNGKAWAQREGALHAAFKHVIAIPYALLGSFLGPGNQPCGASSSLTTCCNPNISTVITTPALSAYSGVSPTAYITTQPAYVTYNLVRVTEPAQPAVEPNVYVYDPLPFQHRE
ncbi:MAG: hypothetical protein BA864_00020 [Desulfuromonadales bacterium C00003093]|nr:MAG: hypothetical protein BA864_00020 [Desulfuromonadales bacterium C00003093]